MKPGACLPSWRAQDCSQGLPRACHALLQDDKGEEFQMQGRALSPQWHSLATGLLFRPLAAPENLPEVSLINSPAQPLVPVPGLSKKFWQLPSHLTIVCHRCAKSQGSTAVSTQNPVSYPWPLSLHAALPPQTTPELIHPLSLGLPCSCLLVPGPCVSIMYMGSRPLGASGCKIIANIMLRQCCTQSQTTA